MASNASILTRHSLFSMRLIGFPRIPTSQLHTHTRIHHNPLHRGPSLSSCNYNPPHLTISTHELKSLYLSNIGPKKFGSCNNLQTSAVSGDGSGGYGGSGDGKSGGSGGGSGSDNGGSGQGGGSNWSLLTWYLSLLGKYPVWTKAVTSALLTLFGDLICQLWIDQVATLDLKRTFLFTFLGLALVGPTLHFWYLYLSRLVTTPGISGVLMRLVLDQFLFAPIFVGVFLSTLLTLEGRPSEVIPKLQQEWFSSVLANWQLWIPFQFFNFRFVPQQFQVVEVEYKIFMYCEGCEKQVAKVISKIKGVEEFMTDMNKHKVVVKGRINADKVLKKLKKKTGKRVEIMTKKDDSKKKSEEKEGNSALEASPKQVADALILQYCGDSMLYTMFSDENANACSIM